MGNQRQAGKKVVGAGRQNGHVLHGMGGVGVMAGSTRQGWARGNQPAGKARAW